ncbi:MAG: hypothetical protein LEGION0398_MBIBDBAK_00234 [Legionellaceae bacterium]
MQTSKPRYYPLFVGLTRTPMLMGVTQLYFVYNLGGCAILLLALLNALSPGILFGGVISLFLGLHVVGLIGCSRDPRFFEILLGKFELSCPNNRYWGCNSYAPH